MKYQSIIYNHQEYTYDNTYQLSTAHGNWYNNNQITYDLSMSYSPCGRILSKTLGGNKYDNSNIPINMDKDLAYDYNTTNPYSVEHIYDGVSGKDEYFNWDVKGNMISHQSPQWNDDKRYLCWTEDNRLQAVKDPNMGAYYNYDASGERNLKLTGSIVDVTQNGTTTYTPFLDQQTLYASALVTINDKGYTKHYFEEGKRICSKIGSGKLRDINTLVGEFWDGYDKQQIYTEEGVTNTYEQCIGITPAIKTEDLYKNIITKYENQVNPDEPAFYYHGDHLSSASYITDDNGNPTQQIVYLPFGEDWVDMKYNTSQFETPYKFNGKEKDEETSYNYYGARYYYDHLSIFLSVDPMSDKCPHLSPYAYCANNPIMLIDPNGEDVIIAGEDGSKYNYGKDKKYEGHDKFIKASIETLDKMNSTDEGKKVLSDLIGSEGIYNITNGKDEEGTGSFVGNKNEKGGTLNMNGNLSLNSLSHELFHSYQHEHGQGGASIFNELEAYSFAFDVTLDYDISTNFMSNTHSGAGTYKLAIDPKTSSGKAYEDSFDKSNYMDTAVKLFQSQSTANNSGLYNKYPLRKNNQKNNLYNLKK